MPRPYNLLNDKNRGRFFTKRTGIGSLFLDGNRGSKNQRFPLGSGEYFLDLKALTLCFFCISIFRANVVGHLA